MLGVSLSVDHFFLTSFSMPVRIFFFFNDSNYFSSTHLFSLLRKYSADFSAAVSCLVGVFSRGVGFFLAVGFFWFGFFKFLFVWVGFFVCVF